jgi:hypothetical protein
VSLLKLASMVSRLFDKERRTDDRCGPGCYGSIIPYGRREIVESRQDLSPLD